MEKSPNLDRRRYFSESSFPRLELTQTYLDDDYHHNLLAFSSLYLRFCGTSDNSYIENDSGSGEVIHSSSIFFSCATVRFLFAIKLTLSVLY